MKKKLIVFLIIPIFSFGQGDYKNASELLKSGILKVNSENYDNKVYMLPKHLDEKVAKLHLERLGVELDELTDEQADYIGVKAKGPFKPDYYRY